MKQTPSATRLLIGALLATLALTPLALSAAEPEPTGPTVRHYQGSPWLGFLLDRNHSEALRVRKVLKRGPAAQAGLREGDIVLAIDETRVKDQRSLKMALRGYTPGDTLAIHVQRHTTRHELELTIASTPSQHELIVRELIGEPAPPLSLTRVGGTQDGATLALSALRGKPTIVDFWATWCEPCEPFKTQLDATQQRFGDAIHIIGVSSEEHSAITAYASAKKPRYDLARDTTQEAHDLCLVSAFPTILILDAEHRVRKVITGRDDPALIDKTIQSILNTSPPTPR